MARFIDKALLLLIFLCCWPAGAVSAQTSAVGPVAETIHIEADRMESDQQREAVLFSGKVEARQGDLIIRADQMTVFYRKNGEMDGTAVSNSKNLDNLEATGNVELVRQDWTASGDRVEFDAEERKIVLTGNTRVWQNNNMVIGDRVVHYLDEGRSVIEKQESSEGGRVKAFFYPQPESEAPPGNDRE